MNEGYNVNLKLFLEDKLAECKILIEKKKKEV